MTGRCFVDANVLVYARDPRVPRKQQRALQWLDLLWRDRRGRTSVQVLGETYVVLTRKLGVAGGEAWQRVERYLAWDPQPVDVSVLRGAREVEQRYRLSWWDSTIVAAAQLQSCEVLLSEDLQDGEIFGSIRVRNPFLHEVRQPEAAYEVQPATRTAHRPRGRPRRAAAL
jgi:predicted nucleic acid-binding protein